MTVEPVFHAAACTERSRLSRPWLAGMLKTTQPTDSGLHGAVAGHLITTGCASPQQIALPMRGAGGAADAAPPSHSAIVSIPAATLTGLAKYGVQHLDRAFNPEHVFCYNDIADKP